MKRRDRRRDNRIILSGVILAAIVVIACLVGYRYLDAFLEDAFKKNRTRAVSLSEEMQEGLVHNETSNETAGTSVTPDPFGPPTLTPEPTETPLPEGQTPVPTITVLPETQMDMTLTPTMDPQEYWESIATPTLTPLPQPTAFMTSLYEAQASGYWGVGIAYASASSSLYQEGYDNSAYSAFDGSTYTSWQEGVDGYGEGEYIYASFDREYQVSYIAFKLGNWRDEGNWRLNSRPSSVTIWIGNAGYQLSFYDSMMDFCVGFTRDIPATDISITVNGVYKGDSKDSQDTCISEITVYGK